MAADSNLNLAGNSNFGNLGNLKTSPLTRGIPRAYFLVPKGTVIPAASLESQAIFATYILAQLQSDNRATRWFVLNNIDTFKDDTKAIGSVDTGLKQFAGTKYDTKHTFRYLQSFINYVEAENFNNCQSSYDIFVLDSNQNLWATVDTTGANGAQCLTLAQLIVEDAKAPDDKDPLGIYMVSVQFDDRRQLNSKSRMFSTGLSADALTGLVNAKLSDVSSVLGTPLTITTTTDIVIIAKAGIDSYDIGQAYGTALTKACFVAKNLTSGATLTITTMNQGNIVAGGQNYYYYWFILSAAPTVGNLVQISLAAPSVTNPIVPLFNTVSEIIQPGIDGANAAVHTF